MAEELPDYDLTCWYINVRRVLELIGMKGVGASLQNIHSLSEVSDFMRQVAIQVALKDSLTEWLRQNNPPTLGQLLVTEGLQPGSIFTHYDRYFCKGLTKVKSALDRGMSTIPAAEAYAKLDSFQSGMKLSIRFHHEHLTSNSSWTELSGQRRLLVLGAVTDMDAERIEAVPFVIADPLVGIFGASSVVGQHWQSRLEIHVDQINNFSKVREATFVRSTKALDALKNISEAEIKAALAEIIPEPTVPKDWGGEKSDLFSSNMIVDGKRLSAAFALKGPSKFHPMTMADLGKNGDQINRLFSEPADLLVLQHCHQITPAVRDTMRAFASQMGNPRLFCIIDGYDTLRLLKAYRKCGLTL